MQWEVSLSIVEEQSSAFIVDFTAIAAISN